VRLGGAKDAKVDSDRIGTSADWAAAGGIGGWPWRRRVAGAKVDNGDSDRRRVGRPMPAVCKWRARCGARLATVPNGRRFGPSRCQPLQAVGNAPSRKSMSGKSWYI